ncbi:hypothetical protein EVAR_66394_1 [Eumeta japonica]|uniref:Uncharacterized protein n=1 Tax=Eumeta variegata TaxID=151549 RepID=A0A4C1ZVN0_EUMVA|nr:hypothetical protein EVAR_66394_1 [Eumeta japonica]
MERLADVSEAGPEAVPSVKSGLRRQMKFSRTEHLIPSRRPHHPQSGPFRGRRLNVLSEALTKRFNSTESKNSLVNEPGTVRLEHTQQMRNT